MILKPIASLVKSVDKMLYRSFSSTMKRHFCTGKGNQQSLSNSQFSSLTVDQLTKEASKNMNKYSIETQIKIYGILSQQIAKGQSTSQILDVISGLEDLMVHKIHTLEIPQIIPLVNSIQKIHRLFKTSNKLHTTLHGRLIRISQIESQQAFPILNTLTSMKWTSKVIQQLFKAIVPELSKQNKSTFSLVLKTTILYAEQSTSSFQLLGELLNILTIRLEKEFDNLSLNENCLLFYLYYTDFLKKHIEQITAYGVARAEMGDILGSATESIFKIMESRKNLESMIASHPIFNQQSKTNLEKRILSQCQQNQLTIREAVLLNPKNVDINELKAVVTKWFLENLNTLTPLQFSQNIPNWSSQDVNKYLADNWSQMSLNQQMFMLYKLSEQYRAEGTPYLKTLTDELSASDTSKVAWKLIQKVTKLLTLYSTPQEQIDKFLDSFDLEQPESSAV